MVIHVREVTAARVAAFYRSFAKGRVDRYRLDNLGALNFVMHEALGGGGTMSLRLDNQGKKDAKLAKRLKDELEWVRSSAKGRQTKSKARLARYEELAAEARGAKLMLLTAPATSRTPAP